MPPEPDELELSVERELGPGADGSPRRARLTKRFRVPPPGPSPTEKELADALGELTRLLDAAVGTPRASREDRGLAELIEAYRPRQPELLDLLRAEGQITPAEHELLSTHVAKLTKGKATPRAVVPAVAPPPPVTERPIAAAPLAADRSPTTPRPIEELLAEYKIESLRQAGAVRARRQISFEEYMALKRHFAPERSEGASGGGP